MKIGLLTFHNAVNYGAALQAYALQKALSSEGYDCEYINYLNDLRKNAYSMKHHFLSNLRKGKVASAAKYLVGTPFMALRKRRFDKFYKRHLKSTRQIYHSSSEARNLNDTYDKFIVGSDQVWNLDHNGNDFAFMLDFVDDSDKKISYSSSFGISNIPEDSASRYRETLADIKHLSVREQLGVDLVRELTGRDVALVLDPVFLLTREQWLEIIPKGSKERNYIFSYTNAKNQLETFLNQTRHYTQGKKIYKLSRHLTVKDFLNSSTKQKYTMSPTDFVRTVNNAELIVSASFHCVALSIILNKPFVAILTGNKGKDERIESLLRLTGLEDRILDAGMTAEQVSSAIDYEKVNKTIGEYRSASFSFLQQALADGMVK